MPGVEGGALAATCRQPLVPRPRHVSRRAPPCLSPMQSSRLRFRVRGNAQRICWRGTCLGVDQRRTWPRAEGFPAEMRYIAPDGRTELSSYTVDWGADATRPASGRLARLRQRDCDPNADSDRLDDLGFDLARSGYNPAETVLNPPPSSGCGRGGHSTRARSSTRNQLSPAMSASMSIVCARRRTSCLWVASTATSSLSMRRTAFRSGGGRVAAADTDLSATDSPAVTTSRTEGSASPQPRCSIGHRIRSTSSVAMASSTPSTCRPEQRGAVGRSHSPRTRFTSTCGGH
jgi:hypothetical protein